MLRANGPTTTATGGCRALNPLVPRKWRWSVVVTKTWTHRGRWLSHEWPPPVGGVSRTMSREWTPLATRMCIFSPAIGGCGQWPVCAEPKLRPAVFLLRSYTYEYVQNYLHRLVIFTRVGRNFRKLRATLITHSFCIVYVDTRRNADADDENHETGLFVEHHLFMIITNTSITDFQHFCLLSKMPFIQPTNVSKSLKNIFQFTPLPSNRSLSLNANSVLSDGIKRDVVALSGWPHWPINRA